MAANRAQKVRDRRDAADRRLQIEADQRHFLGDGGAMFDQLVLAGALQRGQRQQHGVVAQRPRGPRLLDGLRRLADRARDHHQRPVGPVARGLDGEFEHGAIETDLADRELGRMDADRESAGAGVDVVTADGALRLLVELALGIEGQRMRGDHRALAQQGQDRRGQIAPMKGFVGRHGRNPNPIQGRREQRRGWGRRGPSPGPASCAYSRVARRRPALRAMPGSRDGRPARR